MGVVKVIQEPVSWADATKNSTAAADKLSKVGVYGTTAIDAAASIIADSPTVGSACQPLSNLAGQLKIFTGLCGAFNLVNRAKGFVCPSKNGDFAWKFWKKTVDGPEVFADDGYWTWMKTTSEGFLTVAHSMEFIKFFDTIGLYNLGDAAPILSMVKNVAYLPAAVFGIADGGYKIHQCGKWVKNTEAKVWKWEHRKEMGVDELLAKYDAKLVASAAKVRAFADRIGILKTGIKEIEAEKDAEGISKGKKKSLEKRVRPLAAELKALSSFKERLENKQRRWTTYQHELQEARPAIIARLAEETVAGRIAEREGAGEEIDEAARAAIREEVVEELKNKPVSELLDKEAQLIKDCDWKAKAWAKNVESAKYNVGKEKTKNWLGIANNIGKLVIGLTCLIGIFTGIAFNPIFILCVSIGWTATHIFGLAKELYGIYNVQKKIEKPHLPLCGHEGEKAQLPKDHDTPQGPEGYNEVVEELNKKTGDGEAEEVAREDEEHHQEVAV